VVLAAADKQQEPEALGILLLFLHHKAIVEALEPILCLIMGPVVAAALLL